MNKELPLDGHAPSQMARFLNYATSTEFGIRRGRKHGILSQNRNAVLNSAIYIILLYYQAKCFESHAFIGEQSEPLSCHVN